MIDFHCHVLPEIDDGSRNVATSIEIMKTSAMQGVDYMIATPHFYAERDQMDKFLQKRQAAAGRLQEALTELAKERELHVPELFLGGEVAFFKGISRSERICELTVQNTGILLLEMPFHDWTDEYLEEVRKLCESQFSGGRGLQVILAHLERFMMKSNKRNIDAVLEMQENLPLYVQINAEAFRERKNAKTLVKLFKSGKAHFLGSDCHGMHRRPPNLPEGRDYLEKKLGSEFLKQLDRSSALFLRNAGLRIE